MKCLYISPKRYSYNSVVLNGLSANGIEAKEIDYEDFFSPAVNRFVRNYESLPNRIKKIWKKDYVRRINQRYLQEFKSLKPEFVFIYNNQNILPDTIKAFKESSKVAFLLGDNPLYTPTNIYNLQILFGADYIIVPDSFWCEQLRRMGLNNAYFDCFGFSPDDYYPFKVPDDIFGKQKSDMVYVGSAHKNNWGYKRFLYLNQFKKFDIKIYLSGDGYFSHWQNAFPELSDKIVTHNRFDKEFNNLVYNCSKIIPVELVPSLFNGIHIRTFEALGSGIFPLCEYSPDLEHVFKGLDVPFVKDYREAESICSYLLANDTLRNEIVTRMRKTVTESFAGGLVIKRMTDRLFKKNLE